MGVRHIVAACAAATACACGASANAGVIFSSMPTPSAIPAGDWDATYPYTVAGEFTLTDAETIRAVEFVADQSADPTLASFSLFSDDGGAFGKEWVGESSYGPYISSTPETHNSQLIEAVIGRITLGPGTYWLDVDVPAGGIMGFSGSGAMAQCSNTVKDCTPIPQTMGFELLGDPAGDTPIGTVAVPEPAVWAMMLVGLFMVGGTLRLSPRPSWSARGAPAR